MSTRRAVKMREGVRGRPRGLPARRRRANPRRMVGGVLYVLAKEPSPGFAKTRLCPPLSPPAAAALAEAFAADTLAAAAGVAAGPGRTIDVRLALGAAPCGPLPADAGLAATARRLGIAVEDQGGGDLGERMARLLGRGLRSGPTVLIGTDCPDLPADVLRGAFAALERCDAVVGPAVDGGYVLIGARVPVAGLFDIGAEWGSSFVFDATCAALHRAGCAFEALALRDDVDDATALGRLAGRLAGDGATAAPATARLLERWRNEGVRF